jgi:hypothetical protein
MKQLYFSFVCIAFLALGAFRLHLAKKNDCEMTYMHPGYEHISVPGNDSPYSLVRYTGDRKRRDDKVLSTFCHHFASFRPEPIGSFVARVFFFSFKSQHSCAPPQWSLFRATKETCTRFARSGLTCGAWTCRSKSTASTSSQSRQPCTQGSCGSKHALRPWPCAT